MKTITYIPPVGEEFQHEQLETCLCVHTDTYLLMNMQNLSISERMADDINRRVTNAMRAYAQSQDSSDINDVITQSYPELTDGIKEVDAYARYNQTLNSKRERMLEKMKKIDEFVKNTKDAKIKKRAESLRKAAERYYEDALAPYRDFKDNFEKSVSD